MSHTAQNPLKMKNTNKITVVIRPMMRPKLLSCGCFLAILLSGSCNNPPLSLLSSSSIVGGNGSFVVSGELQPASYSSPSSPSSSSSLLSPPPRRRRGASSPASFFPPGSRTKYHKKRRKGGAIGGGGDNKPFSISTVLGVRCGGAAADDDNGEANNGEQGDVEGDSVAGIDDLSSEPLVDVSIIENEESAVIDDGPISSIAELETSESESEESDSTGAQDDDDDDYDIENKESDTTEKTISNPIDISDDDVSSDSDEETNNGESSDPDIPDSSITSSQTATITDDDDDDDNNNNNTAELVRKQSTLRSSASDRRAEAKALHDEGNLSDAAHAFREAASLLDEAASLFPSSGLSEDGDDNERIAVERATCRLHEALCLFKDGRPGECVEACSDVLEDGVTVAAVPSEEEEDGGNDVDGTDGEDATSAKDRSRTATTSVIRIAPTTTAATKTTIPPQIRARAHHRRAKARLALGDLEGALEDARSAAFMGDRNAVQFYGRLMREGSGAASSSSGESMPNNNGGFGNLPFGLSEGPGARGAGTSSSNSFLEGMLEGMGGAGSNPLMPSGSAGSPGDFSSSLLGSLMTGGADDGGNPLGLLGDLLAPPETTAAGKSRRKKKRRGGGGGGGGGMDGLAKSVLSSLVKRIEDEETQETICRYLRSTNTQQIMSFAAMAGVPMKEESARRLVGFANGVTPKGIGRSVSKVKRGISIVKTVRKILKVIDKYKAYIILAVLCYWIRSALTEPYPIGKKEARKLAQKAAFGAMIAPCRGGGSGRSLGNLCGGVVRTLLGTLYSSGNENNGNNDDGASTTSIEGELERLQNQLFLIEAIEERNRAQLDSFVDEEDQWDSLEEDERVLLRSKDVITQEMESLTEQLVMLFMGQKMMDG